MKDVPPFLRRDQTDWHRYQSKYLTRIVGNLFWGWKREGGGGWELRIEFQPNFQSKNFFARGKPSFLKENSLWTGWIFLTRTIPWGFGQRFFPAIRIFFRLGNLLPGNQMSWKAAKLPRLNKTYITSVIHPKANKTQSNDIVLNLFIEKPLVNNRYAGWWRWGKLYDKMKVEEIFVNVWRCCKRFRGIV